MGAQASLFPLCEYELQAYAVPRTHWRAAEARGHTSRSRRRSTIVVGPSDTFWAYEALFMTDGDSRLKHYPPLFVFTPDIGRGMAHHIIGLTLLRL